MLIACPECAHEVSDRASACPKCGFPIAEHVGKQRAAEDAERERTSRTLTDAHADCSACKGRGFRMYDWTNDQGNTKQGFDWCTRCKERGQLPVVHSSGGYWAVTIDEVEAFVNGELGSDSEHVTALGAEAPPPPSYPAPGESKADSSTS